MNGIEDASRYKEINDNHYYSPTLSRRLLGYSYELPDKSPRKEKKWSIGSLFRRKKKENAESSSEEDSSKKGFLTRKKRKPENGNSKKKKPKPVGTFDHVVLSQNTLYSNGLPESQYFSNFGGKNLKVPTNHESSKRMGRYITDSFDDVDNSRVSLGSASTDSSTRKNRKGMAMVRAEARRVTLRNDSSSDEDSSSKFRSDESLSHSSLSRKSRAARTERYLRRYSKDGERSILRPSKSDAENFHVTKLSDDNRSPSRSPVVPASNNASFLSLSTQSPSSISGLLTIPPSHGSHNRIRVISNNSIDKKPQGSFYSQRSASCDGNIHKAEIHPHPEVVQLKRPNSRHRNLSLVDPRRLTTPRQPPPPPPRDPKRLIAQCHESRPTTYYHDERPKLSHSFNVGGETNRKLKPFSSFNLHPSCRSTSEDYLSNPKVVTQEQRPSSTTPEASHRNFIQRHITSNPDNYNYLTDKKPRSRKPIFIEANDGTNKRSDTQKAIDFWRQKERTETIPKMPQMFTCKTSVQTQVFLPSVLQNDINSNNLETPKNCETDEEDLKRKSTNLEEALDELEAIYNSLRLGDEDLLERAEQREREAQSKKVLGALSDSSFNYEPFDSPGRRRKRLLKKSQTIDRRTDDMAYRKLNKEQGRSTTISDPQSVISSLSYLQASPVFTEDNIVHPPANSKEPDIMLDDVVYRNVKYVNSVPKVVEPQPPFGIPLGPITPASNSDYLHAVPEEDRIRLRNIPDLVKDDLAFRNLRKDGTKEPALPVSDAGKLAKASKLDWNSLKKRRAVRSMSANIGSLMNNGNGAKDLGKYRRYDNIDNELSLTDIADAMELSRQILKEKDNNISETRRGFLSDTDANTTNNNYAESRMNFLNSLRAPFVDDNSLQAKPPRGLTPERRSPRSPRESTPIYMSPYDEKRLGIKSVNSSFDDLLTNLAAEAKEASDLINNELEQLEKEEKDDDGLTKTLADIDAVSEQTKKLLENVVSSNDFMTSSKTPVEEVQQIPEATSSIANVVMTRSDSDKNVSEKAACESDHDYENLASDSELNLNLIVNREDATTPFEEHKAELIASFQELKDGLPLDEQQQQLVTTEDEEVTGKQ